jgi:hypothetical protein
LKLLHEIEILGTCFFVGAVLHTFLASSLMKLSHRFRKGSPRQLLFHLFGEVELVFGLWAAVLMLILVVWQGPEFTFQYQESLSFTEPIFVFCIMLVAGTRPILQTVRFGIQSLAGILAKVFKVPSVLADLFVILTLGPIGGSFITEPAAMTVTALLLAALIQRPKQRMIYYLIGTLFVNVSIGGALTSFAAPPILMVASKWGWDFSFVLSHLGWKSALAVSLNSLLFVYLSRNSLKENCQSLKENSSKPETIPLWVSALHFATLIGLVLAAHHAVVVTGVLILFIGTTTITKKYQSALRYRESLFVAFFLAGIVMFGPFQKWWLEPLLARLDNLTLFFGATALTAVTDNAALTFLGSQVESLSVGAKYFLVAGAIAGGGLTIIANAPNAAGYSVLQRHLPDGLSAWKLFLGALMPTAIAVLALGFL